MSFGITTSDISIYLLIGCSIGLALGIALTIWTIRKLGRKANKSPIANTVFYRLTKYRAIVYNIHRQPYNISLTVHDDEDDEDNLMDVLQRQMGFSSKKAKRAVKHAMGIARNEPLQEKIRVALQSLDATNNA